MKGYRRLKTTMGRKYWVKMDKSEVRERKIYHALLVAVPLMTISAFALAAGMLG